jgi:hypothetical protein
MRPTPSSLVIVVFLDSTVVVQPSVRRRHEHLSRGIVVLSIQVIALFSGGGFSFLSSLVSRLVVAGFPIGGVVAVTGGLSRENMDGCMYAANR